MFSGELTFFYVGISLLPSHFEHEDARGNGNIERVHVPSGGYGYEGVAFLTHQPVHACPLAAHDNADLAVQVQLGAAITTSSTVPEALAAMAGGMKTVFTEAGEQTQLFLEFWQQARRDPQVWKEFVAPYRRYQEYFARLVEKGIAEGSFPPQDAMVAGQTLVSLAIGMLVQGIFDPGAAEWDRVAYDGIQILIAGMSADRPRSRNPKGGIT